MKIGKINKRNNAIIKIGKINKRNNAIIKIGKINKRNAIMKIGKINKLKESSATLAHTTHAHMTHGWLFVWWAEVGGIFFIDKLLYQKTMGGVGWGVDANLVWMYSVVFLEDILLRFQSREGFTLILTQMT